MPLRLRPFPAELAGQVSGWASTDVETTMWCGRPTAPVPVEVIQAWAGEDGVRPYGLFHCDSLVAAGEADRLIAYGEVWVDEEEQEVELARLIVDPAERGHGIGRRLVAELVVPARAADPGGRSSSGEVERFTGRRATDATVFMRVHPDNAAALRCYAAAGFVPVDQQLAAQWNVPQPVDYVWLTLGPERVSTSRRIAAAPAAIFDVISDPAGQVRLDGSGMLVGAATTDRLAAVGDAFEMEMDREALGDLPMGRYRTRNVVTRFEPARHLEWAVGSPDGRALGHVYGYELRSLGDAGTEVTSYCDWSAVPPAIKIRFRWPVVPVESLERSLAKLADLVTG